MLHSPGSPYLHPAAAPVRSWRMLSPHHPAKQHRDEVARRVQDGKGFQLDHQLLKGHRRCPLTVNMGVYLGRVLASGLRKSSYLEYAAFSLAALSTDGARRSSEGA